MSKHARRKARRRAQAGPLGPWVLGLETGGDHLGVALLRLPASEIGDDEPAAARLPMVADEVSEHRKHRHAEAILDVVERVLARHGLKASDLGLVAVGRGPGGFTGVRVGMATALGIALGAGVPVWQVCSLQALAMRAAAPGGPLSAPLLDARKGEVYGALYSADEAGALRAVVPPSVAACDALIERFEAVADGRAVSRFGSGALAYGVASPVPLSWHVPSAVNVAQLAAREWDLAGRPEVGPPLDPTYVRPSDAEIAKERARQR